MRQPALLLVGCWAMLFAGLAVPSHAGVWMVPRRPDYNTVRSELVEYVRIGRIQAPGITNRTRFSKTCRDIELNNIAPLQEDPACSNLFTNLEQTLGPQSLSLVCNDDCFTRYMQAYIELEMGVCLDSGELASASFRNYVCQSNGAPSFSCDALAVQAAAAVETTEGCAWYAEGMQQGAGLSPCIDNACFDVYLNQYTTMWNKGCFSNDLALAVPPGNVSDSGACTSPSPSPTVSPSAEATPTMTFSSTPRRSTSPSTSPSFSPSSTNTASPSPTATPPDPRCDLLAMQQFGHLRMTMCKSLLGDGIIDASHAEELCHAPCLNEYLDGYRVLLDQGCVAPDTLRGGVRSAEEVKAHLCGYTAHEGGILLNDFHMPTLPSGREGMSTIASVEATIIITLTRLVPPPAFQRLYGVLFERALASRMGVAVNRLRVRDVHAGIGDAVELTVVFEAPAAGVASARESLFESLAGTNPEVRDSFNRELAKLQSNTLQAMEVHLERMDEPLLLPACDGAVRRAERACEDPGALQVAMNLLAAKKEAASRKSTPRNDTSPASATTAAIGGSLSLDGTVDRPMCAVERPSESCCLAVFHVVANRCGSGKTVCGEAWSSYFDERCIIARRPKPASERGTVQLNKIPPGQGADEHGCVAAHNYTWCQRKGTCVQNYPGGDGFPCPYDPPLWSQCRGNCSHHGVCAGNNTCICQRGYAGRKCQISCPGLCNGNGDCQRSGECACDEGWKGERCQYRDYQQLPMVETFDCYGLNVTYGSKLCNGRGNCWNHRCHCNYGYAGEHCERHTFAPCLNQCRGFADRCIVPRTLAEPTGEQALVQFWSWWSDDEHNGWTPEDLGEFACLCRAGYFGEDCSSWSPPPTCPHGCSGRGLCTDQGCACDDGFTGAGCESKISCMSNCSGHGECGDGGQPGCTCARGYSGQGCERYAESPCPMGCSGHGTCNASTRQCVCHRGYEGAACSHVKVDPVCAACKHGTCKSWHRNFTRSSPGKKHNQCVCEYGWRGANCDEPYLCAGLGFCSGRGTCDRETVSCKCVAGFHGEDCSRVPDLCPGFCSGHGRCRHALSYDRATGELSMTGKCDCRAGWKGDDCATSMCGEVNGVVCNGHGICELVEGRNHAVWTCTCDEGWLGQNCQEKEDECPGSPLPCSGPEHGMCKDGTCLCSVDWAGEDCSEPTSEARIRMAQASAQEESGSCCPGACSSNGICLDCKCSCEEGWGGDACQNFVLGDDTVVP